MGNSQPRQDIQPSAADGRDGVRGCGRREHGPARRRPNRIRDTLQQGRQRYPGTLRGVYRQNSFLGTLVGDR